MSGWEIRSPPPLEDRRFGFDVRYLRGTIAVLLLVVFWSVIVPLIDRSLDSITIPPGTVVEIGHTGVTFTPACAETWDYLEAAAKKGTEVTVHFSETAGKKTAHAFHHAS